MSLAAKAASGDVRLSERHAARAVELLLRAKLKKFFRDEAMVEFLKNDEDLKFLDGRPDYKQFLDDLEAGRKKPGK